MLRRLLEWVETRLSRLGGWIRRLLGRPVEDRDDRRRRRKRRKPPPTAMSTYGTRVGEHAGIYGAGNVGQIVVALVTVAVLTRFLPPAEFGRYHIFVAFASLLTLLYSLPTQRGVMRWVFGSSGDDDDEDDEDDDESSIEAPEGEKRKALGTGIAFMALLAALGLLLVWLLAPVVVGLVSGDESDARIVIYAALAAAFLTVWQVAATVPRRERRPKTFVFLNVSRPLFVLLGTVPLVALDPSVESAVLGMAVGGAAAAAVSLLLTRRSFQPAFRVRDVRNIIRLAAPFIPLNASYWVIGQGGVFILGAYSTTAVGIYRVASSVATLAYLPVSAFLRASGPLRRDPIGGAVRAERGKVGAGALLATYFAHAAAGILLAFAVGADVLVRIAPPAYEAAAPLIPLLGLAAVMQGGVRVVRRTTNFKRKRRLYIQSVTLGGLLFVGLGIALVPSLGAYGLGLALILTFLAVQAAMLVRAQRGPTPTPYDLRRIIAGFTLAAACYAAGRLGAAALEPAALVIELGAIVAYPVLLVATGIVPRDHVHRLGRIGAATIPGRSAARNGRVDLSGMDDVHRAVLELIVRHHQPVVDVALVSGTSQDVVARQFVAALRQLGGIGVPSEGDGRIGAYLLSPGSIADRDVIWRKLLSDGMVDPMDTDALKLTLERLRRAPATTWRAS